MTILRKAEHQALSQEIFEGSVIDLGGHANSEYVRFLKGTFTRTTANLSKDADIQCDFEKPLPMKDGEYNAALLINVLEHIFEYRQLLQETARILAPGGKIVIVVPFLFPYHPSPHDYHRYTPTALERALEKAGFKNIVITSLGTGLFQAQWLMIERLVPKFLQPISIVMGPLHAGCDWVFVRLAQLLKKKYVASDYALGYKVVAMK